jgi:hypothetical protein
LVFPFSPPGGARRGGFVFSPLRAKPTVTAGDKRVLETDLPIVFQGR